MKARISSSCKLLCLWKTQKICSTCMHNFPYMFGYWANTVVHLILLGSSMNDRSQVCFCQMPSLLNSVYLPTYMLKWYLKTQTKTRKILCHRCKNKFATINICQVMLKLFFCLRCFIRYPVRYIFPHCII